MHDCIGIVLAGGLSSRMGKDKATLMRGQQTMLDFSQSILNAVGVEKVIVSGSGSGSGSGSHNAIADIYPQLGPIGGIYSVLSTTPCRGALILPVDLPLITAETLTALKVAGELNHCAVHYTDQPLPLYIPNNSFTELFFKQLITQTARQKSNNEKNKGLSIKAMLKQMPYKTIHCKNAQTLINTNTPEQWQAIQAQIAKQSSQKSALQFTQQTMSKNSRSI